MKHKIHGQMSDSFLTAAFLSVSGGLQDAYTYIFRGKVFANAQTGNIVLLSQSIAEKNWHLALHYLVPLVFFAFGIAFSEFVHIKYRKIQKFHWRQLVVFNEIILLFVVGFLPLEWNLLANAIVSFSCAMQVQAFRKVNGYAFASTMCIGNMRSGVESLCAYVKTKDKKILHKSLCYWAIIIMFAIGAGLGGYFVKLFNMRTIWVSCGLLFVSFMIMFIKEDVPEIEKDVRKLEKNINKIIKIISGIGLIFMVYCIVIPAILDIPTLVKQEYTVTEGIVESWNYSDEERLEERSISIKDDTGQEKSVIVYSTGIHQGEHLVVEYLPHSKYGIVKERIR